MKTPEKIYISEPIKPTEDKPIFFAYTEKDFLAKNEYIRSDIAKSESEKLVKEYLYSIGWSELITNGQFTEFINSRNK